MTHDADARGWPWVTVVSGFPRSGTSMLMQILRAGGMPVTTDGARAADADNPRGYLEWEGAKRLGTPGADRAFAALAGRAVKVVHPLLYRVPAGVPVRVVIAERDLGEVLASQRVMLERRGRLLSATEPLHGAMTRERERRARWLAGPAAPPWCAVRYDEVVRDPPAAARALATFLGGGLDVERMAAAVDAALHRNRAGAGQR